MVDATISRVRGVIWHAWAAEAATAAGGAGLHRGLRFATSAVSRCHQQREPSVAAPQTHQLTPRTVDLMASTIQRFLWHSGRLMSERRLTNSERRLRRITTEEPEQPRRGILELFREEEKELPAEDAPLAREGDDSAT